MSLIEKYNSQENRKKWQEFLNSNGFRLEIDGIDGPATTRATAAFQIANSVNNDGIVGEETLRAAITDGFEGFESRTPVAEPVVIEDKNLARLNGCHPQLREKVSTLVGLAANEGFTLRVVQGARTFEEQDRLFRQWRDGRDNDGDGRVDEADERVTRAAGGQSNHNYGVAADLAFVVDNKVSWDDSLYSNIGRWARTCGLDWGGDWKGFKDLPHVELRNCPNWRKLLEVYKSKGMPAVWAIFGE